MTDAIVDSSDRFAFGKNWSNFLQLLDQERIDEATKSLREMLGVESLAKLRFLDIGSGSGLFSLAAHQLGAEVVSFDFDPDSVKCTKALQQKFASDSASWKVLQGSVLDDQFLQALGSFDVVYSWGVLHHTGGMWRACENVAKLVRPKGKLFIAIYNDQGIFSKIWLHIKHFYNRSGRLVRWVLLGVLFLLAELAVAIRRLLSGQSPLPLKAWREKKKQRGMSVWYDHVDWIGGYPFEVAKPEEIFEFYKKRGFELEKLKTRAGGHGCCEYVFSRSGTLA